MQQSMGVKKKRKESARQNVFPDKGEQNQKGLPHPCLPGGPQAGGNATSPLHTQGSPKQRGTKSEVAASPLPSWGHTSGRKCYALHTRGSPNKGGQNQKWPPHPCLRGGPQVGRNATSPLHSRGSPKQRGTKSEMGSTLLPSRGPKKGGNAASPLHSGGRWLGGQNQKWLNWGQGQNFGCPVQKNTTKKISPKWCVCVEKHP